MKWKEKFTINDNDCINGKSNYKNIFQIMMDTTFEQSKSINNTVEDLLKDGYTWMIHKWCVEFKRIPLSGEELSVETWASEFKRLNAFREFSIKDSKGEELVKASSIFLMIDLQSKMPIRIPENTANDYQPENHKNFQKIERLKLQGDFLNKTEFNITNEDIDKNEHVNNTVYIEWIAKSIKENKDYLYKELKNINIIYKQEVKDVNKVIVENYKDNDRIYSIIKTDSNEKNEHAISCTIWK